MTLSWNEQEVTYRQIQTFLLTMSWWTTTSVSGTSNHGMNRNTKLTRLIWFVYFKIWHIHSPRNTTRSAPRKATSFWISRCTQKITSGSRRGDVYRLAFTNLSAYLRHSFVKPSFTCSSVFWWSNCRVDFGSGASFRSHLRCGTGQCGH